MFCFSSIQKKTNYWINFKSKFYAFKHHGDEKWCASNATKLFWRPKFSVNVFLPGWRNFPYASADESSRVAWSENLEGKMFKLRMRNLSLKTKKLALETVIDG